MLLALFSFDVLNCIDDISGVRQAFEGYSHSRFRVEHSSIVFSWTGMELDAMSG